MHLRTALTVLAPPGRLPGAYGRFTALGIVLGTVYPAIPGEWNRPARRLREMPRTPRVPVTP
ncbi:hypothetical protein SSP531S_38010 [Streptomyces spongiicola]|uniref:Uncharacterized protein n=1 Tax=Streptomyces spongiicola TaxID=1690221 RepID=A0A388T2H7_9ACTN|nr:hypothetical protein SSP531S_38010 [Streptomyces spongiicola]